MIVVPFYPVSAMIVAAYTVLGDDVYVSLISTCDWVSLETRIIQYDRWTDPFPLQR